MAPDFVIIATNELRGIVRQKRVIITVTLIPLLLLPLFLLGMGGLFYLSEKKMQERVFNVAVENGTKAESFVKYIENSNNFTIVNSMNWREDLSNEIIELYIRFPDNFTSKIEDLQTGKMTVYYSSAVPASARAKNDFELLVWDFIHNERGNRLNRKDLYLFTLESDFGEYLHNGTIDDTLGKALANNSLRLSDRAVLAKIDDEWWKIADGYLFELESDHSRYLEIGKVDAEMKMAFENNSLLLSTGARLTKVNNEWWEITDRSKVYHAHNNSTGVMIYGQGYKIQRTDGGLNAYRELSTDILTVVDDDYYDKATVEEKSGSILGTILPYFVVIYLMSGAMSIGLDAVAGEKERNTLGTLLVNKVSRTSIVIGKIISVMAISFISALFTIGGLGIILAGGIIFGGGGSGSAFAAFTPWVILGLFLILIPLSTVLVSIIILVGTFARNLKEASSYMTPVFFIVIFLGIMTMSINFDITERVYLIPIASSVFAMKDLLLGKLTLSLLMVNLVVTLITAGILIYLCVRMFKSEKILFRI